MVDRGLVLAGVGRVFHRAGHRISQSDAFERALCRRVNLVRNVADVAAAFKHAFLRELTWNDRPLGGLARDRMDDIADFQCRNINAQHLHVRVVDIHLHLALVDGLLGIGGHINRHGFAVWLDNFQPGNFHRGIGKHETQREGSIVAFALLGQDLGESVILSFAGAVRPIHPDHLPLDGGFVAVRIFGQRDLGGGGQDCLGICRGEKLSGVTVGALAADPRRRTKREG